MEGIHAKGSGSEYYDPPLVLVTLAMYYYPVTSLLFFSYMHRGIRQFCIAVWLLAIFAMNGKHTSDYKTTTEGAVMCHFTCFYVVYHISCSNMLAVRINGRVAKKKKKKKKERVVLLL